MEDKANYWLSVCTHVYKNHRLVRQERPPTRPIARCRLGARKRTAQISKRWYTPPPRPAADAVGRSQAPPRGAQTAHRPTTPQWG